MSYRIAIAARLWEPVSAPIPSPKDRFPTAMLLNRGRPSRCPAQRFGGRHRKTGGDSDCRPQYTFRQVQEDSP